MGNGCSTVGDDKIEPNSPSTNNTNQDTVNTVSDEKSFVRAWGKQIIDPQGQPLILRGVNLGGWMLQEPYLMGISKCVSHAQYDLFEKIKQVCQSKEDDQFSTDDFLGADFTYDELDHYRQAWLRNMITREDIAEVKRWGFNSVRVPLHYNLFTKAVEDEEEPTHDTWVGLEEDASTSEEIEDDHHNDSTTNATNTTDQMNGWKKLDQLIDWCKQNGLYVILDMHAAPGGQGRDSPISDYDKSKKSFWEDDNNRRKCIALWRKLAQRYAKSEIIAAYDLLNETNWMFEQTGNKNGCNDHKNKPLREFYQHCITAIRGVDPHHMIMIEGNGWSNNHNGIWPLGDGNLVLCFHLYHTKAGCPKSLKKYLQWRDKYKVPLHCGEFGENHNLWAKQSVKLMEECKIGWCWWTWKSMGGESSKCFTIPQPRKYSKLIDYWSKAAVEPFNLDGFQIMMQVAENAKLENCKRNGSVLRSLFPPCKRFSDENEFIPLQSQKDSPPVRLLVAEDHVDSHPEVAMEETADQGGGYENVAWLAAGTWVALDIHVPETGLFRVKYRIASPSGDGGVCLKFNGGHESVELSDFPSTGGWQKWDSVEHVVSFPVAGNVRLTVQSTAGGWNLHWIEISRVW